ncbi:hypothetical protein RUM43_014863 [Polyplax serrata]|uniref:Uncharacterized protein n=1 Tax=Polyplax serrata TaxID=468196 RepID=A0AAN8NYR0_POLSC
MWCLGNEEEDEEEEDLMFSPALMARRASESWITTPPTEAVAVNQTLQRKKSLPDVQVLPKSVTPMSREEASVLSSARREEVRKQREESERLRANPLLYFLSPHFKTASINMDKVTVRQTRNEFQYGICLPRMTCSKENEDGLCKRF